jgi:hypothetical protein
MDSSIAKFGPPTISLDVGVEILSLPFESVSRVPALEICGTNPINTTAKYKYFLNIIAGIIGLFLIIFASSSSVSVTAMCYQELQIPSLRSLFAVLGTFMISIGQEKKWRFSPAPDGF